MSDEIFDWSEGEIPEKTLIWVCVPEKPVLPATRVGDTVYALTEAGIKNYDSLEIDYWSKIPRTNPYQ